MLSTRRRPGAWTPGRDSSSLGSSPCSLPPALGWGALFPGDPKLEMPHETPRCSPLAFCSRTCPQERPEKRFFSCRPFPISVRGGPRNYRGSGTVSNSPRPAAAERVCHRPCSRQHCLRMSSSAQGPPSWASASQDASPALAHRALGFRHGGRWEERNDVSARPGSPQSPLEGGGAWSTSGGHWGPQVDSPWFWGRT